MRWLGRTITPAIAVLREQLSPRKDENPPIMTHQSLILGAVPISVGLGSLQGLAGLTADPERALPLVERMEAGGLLGVQDLSNLREFRGLIASGRAEEARPSLLRILQTAKARRAEQIREVLECIAGPSAVSLGRGVEAAVWDARAADFSREARLPILLELLDRPSDPPVGQGLREGDVLYGGGTRPETILHYGKPSPSLGGPAASRRLWFEDGVFWIEDTGASGGTWSEGRRLEAGERRAVRHKDEIVCGTHRYRVRLPLGYVLKAASEPLWIPETVDRLADVLDGMRLESLSRAVRALGASSDDLVDLYQKIDREIPDDAGLAAKLKELVALDRFRALVGAFFPYLSHCAALQALLGIAQSVRRLGSVKEIRDYLAVLVGLENRELLLEPLAGVLNGTASPSSVPRAFGLRERVEGLAAEEFARRQGRERMVFAEADLSPREFAERAWSWIRVPDRLRTCLEAFRDIAAQKFDLENVAGDLSGMEEDDLPFVQAPENPVLRTEMALYRRYVAQQASSSLTPSSDPKGPWTDNLREELRKKGVDLPFDGTWLFGGDIPLRSAQGRIYLSLRRREALSIGEYLSKVLYPGLKFRGVGLQFKFNAHREGLRRSDSGVVYFEAQGQEAVYEAVARMRRERPEFFKEGAPHFASPLLDSEGAPLGGVSFGEQPANHGVSFGGLRTRALQKGIRIARLLRDRGETIDWDLLCRIFAFSLDRAGVDIRDPSFNKNGADFSFLRDRLAFPVPSF